MIINKNNISRLAQLLAILIISTTSALAMDSSNLPMGNHVSATTHSFVLSAGTSSFVQGHDQLIGTTIAECPVGSTAKVVTSLNDAGTSQSSTFCPLDSIHAVGAYTTSNPTTGGYNVFIGYSNVSTPLVCSDRGVSLNWTVYCLKGAMA
ncbi:MAG: hypothetical protein P4M14_09115 [Gammaproteobacteria bacterium]|nr:hypothetical protein [Gammaproteobacteria bacterium]